MVAIRKCWPCQAGDCANCDGGHPAPKGMLGGTKCPCDGKCETEPLPFIDRMVEALKSVTADPEGGQR